VPSQDVQMQNQFLHHLKHWAWMHFLYEYGENHLLVADPFFLRQVRQARKAELKMQVATPAKALGAVTDSVEKILVLCQQGELALVRQLQAAFPDKAVVSGTYGFALTGKDRHPRLRPFQLSKGRQSIRGKQAKLAPPVVILSTAYADAEYVCARMQQFGLPYAHEHLSRLFQSWLHLHQGFQPLRFYGELVRHFSKQGRVCTLLQLDVLQAVMQNSALSMPRFIRFLREQGAKVILFTNSAKMAQASRGQLLDATVERSIWTAKGSFSKRAHLPRRKIGPLLRRMESLSGQDELLDEFRAAGLGHFDLTLEEFCRDEDAKLKELAAFVEIEPEASSNQNVKPYNEGYQAFPQFSRNVDMHRSELIDRLGLHVHSPVE